MERWTTRRHRWQLSWRLSWSFACPIHQRLLADNGPSCGQSQRFRSSAQHHPPQPGHRENPIHPADHGQGRGPAKAHARCGADLSRAATITLPSDHPVLRTQRLLDNLIDTGKAAFGVYATQPQPALTALADIRHRRPGHRAHSHQRGQPCLCRARTRAGA